MSKKFIVFILALLGVMFVVQYRMPKRFVWKQSYLHTDRQPFGCYVFDSVLAVSMPKGYTVTRKTLWEMNQDSLTGYSVIVSTAEYEYFDAGKAAQVLRLAARGNKVLVPFNNSYDNPLSDSLSLTVVSDHRFSLEGMKKQEEFTKIVWDGEEDTIPLRSQMVSRSFLFNDTTRHIVTDSSSLHHSYCFYSEWRTWEDGEVINRYKKRQNLVVGMPVGKGEVILCSTPLLLTNYAMLNDECRRHTSRLMGLLKERPVVRTEALLTPRASQQESPFYLLLDRPPLRWALNLTLLTVVIFVVFTARRRQRIIPVVEPLKNENKEFVKLIGTLYHQQGDAYELMRMKLKYATEEIRRKTGTDPDETGLLDEVKKAVYSPEGITEADMLRYTEQLNDIIKNL